MINPTSFAVDLYAFQLSSHCAATDEHLAAGFSPRLNASVVVIVSLDIGGYNETPGRQKHTLTHSLQPSTGAATGVIVFFFIPHHLGDSNEPPRVLISRVILFSLPSVWTLWELVFPPGSFE